MDAETLKGLVGISDTNGRLRTEADGLGATGGDLQQNRTTCMVEPAEEVLPAARARARLRYAKILRHAAQEVATRNKATLEEVLSHGDQH